MGGAIIIILIGTIASIYISLQQRKRFSFPQDIDLEKIPEIFKAEVKKQLNDGYKLSSVSEQSIIMVKRRHLLLPWGLMFFCLLPLNVAFNSWYQCGLYCLRIRAVDNEIEIDTL